MLAHLLVLVLVQSVMHGCWRSTVHSDGSDGDCDDYAMLARCSATGPSSAGALSREQIDAVRQLCATSSDEEQEEEARAYSPGPSETSTAAHTDDGARATMLQSMRARDDSASVSSGTTDERRGRYDRAAEGVRKRQTEAEYALAHRERIESNTFGVPCGAMCVNHRKCGWNITQATLLAAHVRVYGAEAPELVRGKYCVSRAAAEIRRTRRALMLSWVTRDVTSNTTREVYTVERVGPVCADFAKAAYDFHDWTWNTMHAAALSGALEVDIDLDAAGVVRSAQLDVHNSSTAEMAVTWWKLWLALEDQMPNEPVIVHRAVKWLTVYDEEYMVDMAMWGYGSVSRSRWTNLRREALAQLSIEYFGQVSDCDRDDPRLSQAQLEMLIAGEGYGTPVCTLSLLQRAQHSNFSGCTECTKAKEKWVAFRQRANRSSSVEANDLKKTLFTHIENVKRERQARACTRTRTRTRTRRRTHAHAHALAFARTRTRLPSRARAWHAHVCLRTGGNGAASVVLVSELLQF